MRFAVATLSALAALAVVALCMSAEPEEATRLASPRSTAEPVALAAPAKSAPTLEAPPVFNEEALASLGRIAERALERSQRPSLEAVFERCAGRPRDLLVGLEGHMRRYPEDAPALAQRLRVERDSERLFVMARGLGRAQEDPATRAVTLDVLRGLDPERRAVGLAALVGRSEPEVAAFLLDVLEGDASDAARARAGSLLSHTLDSLQPADAQRALWIARATLGEVSPSEGRVIAAAELLARANAGREDRALLQAALGRAESPGALGALAYGLAAATSDPQALRSALQSRRADPACPPGLHPALDSLLAAMP